MEKSKITMQLWAGSAATLSAMCTGFHQGWSAPSLPKLLAKDSDILITSDQSSWIVTLFPLGSIFGALISAVLIDRCGRKLSLLTTVIPHLSSCILIGAAQSYWWLMTARFLAGLGLGITYAVTPIYLAEIADDRIRGALGNIFGLMLSIGILLAYCVGPWVSRVAFAVFGGTMPFIFGLIFIWMPESPYFLMMTGRLDSAVKSLQRLRGKETINEELKKLQTNIEINQKNSGSLKDLVMIPGNRKALIIILGLVFAPQMSGINAVLAYVGLIFEESGSPLDSSISVIIIGVIKFFSVVVSIFTVDIAGRRPLLLFSCGGSIIFLGGEALYFQLQAIGFDVSVISWLPITCIIGYVFCYTIGFGSLPFVVISEIFPYNVKALATMIGTVASAICSVAVSKLYQVVADAYGIHVSFWGFAGITIFSGIFIYFTLPETKKRSFRSIQEELHKTTESTFELTR